MTDIRYKFQGRVIGHDLFKDEIARELKRWGFDVVDNGREVAHCGLNLNGSNDIGSRLIRFAPDIAIMWGKNTFYVDAKKSLFVEDQPYNHYCWMFDLGINVYIVSKNGSEKVRFSHIDDLELTTASHRVWPINEDGWIAPRDHPDYAYLKQHYPPDGKPYPGSGTPFRKMDFAYMAEWGPMMIQFDLQRRKW